MPNSLNSGESELEVCNTNQHDSPVVRRHSVDARNIAQCCKTFCHFLSSIIFYKSWYVTAGSAQVSGVIIKMAGYMEKRLTSQALI